MTENPPVEVLFVPEDASGIADADLGFADRDVAGDGEQVGTVDVAKDQASSVGHSAAQAGQAVAGTAQDQAKTVVAEAGSQARDLLSEARTELTGQAGAQQQRLAAALHALGDELHSMTKHSDKAGVATDLAGQGASKSHDIASWLDDREPGHLVQELQQFARQRPGTFLLAAAGAGLLAGRLTRGVKDAGGDDDEVATATPAAGAPVDTLPAISVPADSALTGL